MKGIIYALEVCNSEFEALHGQYYTIRELFIPELGVVVNERNIWEDTEKRYEAKRTFQGMSEPAKKIDEIELTSEQIVTLMGFLDREKEQAMVKEWLQKQLAPKQSQSKFEEMSENQAENQYDFRITKSSRDATYDFKMDIEQLRKDLLAKHGKFTKSRDFYGNEYEQPTKDAVLRIIYNHFKFDMGRSSYNPSVKLARLPESNNDEGCFFLK